MEERAGYSYKGNNYAILKKTPYPHCIFGNRADKCWDCKEGSLVEKRYIDISGNKGYLILHSDTFCISIADEHVTPITYKDAKKHLLALQI